MLGGVFDVDRRLTLFGSVFVDEEKTPDRTFFPDSYL
jgi:hypothetical protein